MQDVRMEMPFLNGCNCNETILDAHRSGLVQAPGGLKMVVVADASPGMNSPELFQACEQGRSKWAHQTSSTRRAFLKDCAGECQGHIASVCL